MVGGGRGRYPCRLSVSLTMVTSPQREKMMTNPTRTVLAAALLIAFLGTVLFFMNKEPAPEIEVQDISVKQIIGSTVEERLANAGIDVSNAHITKITDVEALKEKYSGIFKDAKNGQYLVELPEAIVVYDFEHDEVIARFDVVRMEIG